MAVNKRLIKSNDEGGGLTTSFNTVLYTGNYSGQSIAGAGFQPDFIWFKNRSITQSHHLFDSVRGTSFDLSSNRSDAELNRGSEFSSFDSDGFTLGTGTNMNNNGNNYVAWCWKAGGAAVTNTDGTITSQVSANPGAGFSIVSYTANAISGATVGHGLNKELDFLIVKSTNLTEAWSVYVKNITDTDAKYLRLNESNGIYTTAFPRFIVGNFNSNVFSVGDNNSTNGISGTDKYIAYCFAEVAGFSKFGSYAGDGGSNNTVTTGFEPAFLMIKCSSTSEQWFMFDNKRQTTASKSKYLTAQSSSAEADYGPGTPLVEFTSTGFILKQGEPSNTVNGSGDTYIYMAFANQF